MNKRRTLQLAHFDYDNDSNGILVLKTDMNEKTIESKLIQFINRELNKHTSSQDDHNVIIHQDDIFDWLDYLEIKNVFDQERYLDDKFMNKLRAPFISKVVYVSYTNKHVVVSSSSENLEQDIKNINKSVRAYVLGYEDGYDKAYQDGEYYGSFDEYDIDEDPYVEERFSHSYFEYFAYVRGYIEGQVPGLRDGIENN